MQIILRGLYKILTFFENNLLGTALLIFTALILSALYKTNQTWIQPLIERIVSGLGEMTILFLILVVAFIVIFVFTAAILSGCKHLIKLCLK